MNWLGNIIIGNGNVVVKEKFCGVSIEKSTVIADGNMIVKDRSFRKLEIETNDDFPLIRFIGNCESVSSTSGNVAITGNTESAQSTSGDIRISCDVTGYVSSTSGDVRAGKIIGSKKTVSGSVN